MFDAIALKDHTPEITGILICPESITGKLYSYEIVFNCGGKNTNLIPILKDIVGTACPFIDTGKFKAEYLQSIRVTIDGINLSYCDPDITDTTTSVDFFIDIDDIYSALRQEQFSIGVYLYEEATHDVTGASIKRGDAALLEAYDFSFDIDSDAVLVSVATNKLEADYCLVDALAHFGDTVEST